MTTLSAYNIAMRSFTGDIGGEKTTSTNWSTSTTNNAGCNPNLNKNHVLVIKFTIDKRAKSVNIPLKSIAANSLVTNGWLLCYGLGEDPDVDTSMVNITGSDKAMGTFCFPSYNSNTVITLTRAKPGTNYLYIWGEDPTVASQTSIEARHTVTTGITYEELKGLVYIKGETDYEPHEVYIFNGEGWDMYIPYVKSETGWDQCG